MEGDTANTGTAKKATKGLKKKKWIANEWEIFISMWAESLRRISLQNGNQIAAKSPLKLQLK